MLGSPAIAKIYELLQKKIQLMEKLLAYASQQAGLSYTDNPVNYENIVESRAIAIEEIKKLDIVLQQKLDALGELGDDVKTHINGANTRVSDLAHEIITLDKKSKILISSEMKQVDNKLQVLQKGKKGIIGYDMNVNFSPSGAYTDSKR